MEGKTDLLHTKINSVDFTCKVLLNDLVFDCISSFLSLGDLKPFRLVCRKWKDISEAAFKKRVRICFDFGHTNSNPNICIKDNKSSFTQYPAPDDLKAFFRTSQALHPFTAIRLSKILPWTNSALTEFFSTEGKHITDLVLEDVKLKNDDNTSTKHENIENVHFMRIFGGVENFHFMRIFGGVENLQKIQVERFSVNRTRFIFNLDDLSRIPCIKLKDCIVELTDSRMTPIELEFVDLIFVRHGTRVDSVLLNDFVNFTSMEKLTISAVYFPPFLFTTKIKLNLSGSEKIKFVKLGYLNVDGAPVEDIVDFNNSLWEIETLDLFNIPFQQTNNMVIQHLFIENIKFSPLCFPQSLQKLRLTNEIEFPENLSWDLSLSKLKTLDLTGTDVIDKVFPHLLHCFDNLVELKLKYKLCFPGIARIDVNLIPPRVQKILFIGTDFEFVGDGVRAIQTLVLKEASLEFAKEICNHFVPKYLVAFVESVKMEYGMDEGLTKALSKICEQGIILGIFDWKNSGHENDDFAFPSVDLPGEFYFYINGRGDVITCHYGTRSKIPLKFIRLISQMAEFQ